MKKSFSQRVARFLEIICYFLIIPTTLIEIVTIYYSLIFLISGMPDFLYFAVPLTAIYAFGNLLFYGYYKHSRGKLSNSNSLWLWIGTFLFNFIPFACILWLMMSNSFIFGADKTENIWFYNIFALYLTISVLAAIALFQDWRSVEV